MSDLMSDEERAEARAHLAELRRIVDELEGAGMDVRTMRATIKTVEKQMGSDKAEAIEAWLRGQPHETVIRYQARYGSGSTYTWAAVKVVNTWYTTADSGPRQFGSRQLAKWMADTVHLVDLVRMTTMRTPVQRADRPDVEMGP